MAQRIVKEKPEFGRYVGVSAELSEDIALLDTMIGITNKKGEVIHEGLITNEQSKIVLRQLQRMLIFQNRALFSATCSELSKLSFILGLKDDSITAVKQTPP